MEGGTFAEMLLVSKELLRFARMKIPILQRALQRSLRDYYKRRSRVLSFDASHFADLADCDCENVDAEEELFEDPELAGPRISLFKLFPL